MFARAKLELADIGDDVMARLGRADDRAAGADQAETGDDDRTLALAVELPATNDRGQPASGTIGPPAVSWRIDD